MGSQDGMLRRGTPLLVEPVLYLLTYIATFFFFFLLGMEPRALSVLDNALLLSHLPSQSHILIIVKITR